MADEILSLLDARLNLVCQVLHATAEQISGRHMDYHHIHLAARQLVAAEDAHAAAMQDRAGDRVVYVGDGDAMSGGDQLGP